MNFSKLLAYANGFSLLILMMGIDSLKNPIPCLILMVVNIGYLMWYTNKKGNAYEEMQDCY